MTRPLPGDMLSQPVADPLQCPQQPHRDGAGERTRSYVYRCHTVDAVSVSVQRLGTAGEEEHQPGDGGAVLKQQRRLTKCGDDFPRMFLHHLRFVSHSITCRARGSDSSFTSTMPR